MLGVMFLLILHRFCVFTLDFHTAQISVWVKKYTSFSPFKQSWRSRLFFFCVGPKMLNPHWAFLLSSLDLINNRWNSHSLAGRDCLEKTWKTSHSSAGPRASHRRQGSAWSPISTSVLQSLAGCDCLAACSKPDSHTHTDGHLWRAADLLP